MERRPRVLGAVAVISFAAIAGCAGSHSETPAVAVDRPGVLSGEEAAFLDSLQARTFGYFWELSDSLTGLTPDRYPTRSFASVSATGFALTAYPIGVERGQVTREQARRRVLATLRFFWRAEQGTTPSGKTGHQGFFYHFLEPETGHRFENVELSSVDTALFFAGALFCQSYFDRDDPLEREIRALADSLYFRADWEWLSPRRPAIGHGWTPEEGFLEYDWRGYNEAMLVYLLALGSPTHPADPAAWDAWVSEYRWGSFHGQEHVGFGPLFGHHYTHVWIDFRGIQDAAMRARGIDYFENSRRATLAQRAYAMANPNGWAEYGARLWGLSACDGPVEGTFEIGGRQRSFHTYWGRGASFTDVQDDGTIAPTAAGGSIAFAPEIVIPLLRALAEDHGERVYREFGFVDALNPTFRLSVPVQHGWVDPDHGWYDRDYLGIDQGPILCMIENLRTGLVWETMRRNAHVVRGLRRAGFRGGWLDEDTDP